MSILAIGSQITNNFLLVVFTYAILAFLYLAIVPLFLYYWMNRRWNFMGKLERLSVYGLVFVFFPGMILFAPFLNLRLHGQGDGEV